MKIKILIPAILLLSGCGGSGTSTAPTPIIGTPSKGWVDSAGNIFIADSSNLTVRKVTASTGIISKIAGTIGTSGNGGDGAAATSAQLSYPANIALDSLGNVYIAAGGNSAIRMIDVSTGFISTVAGTNGTPGSTGDGGLATSAKLANPAAIVFDSAGNLYIGDTNNFVVRKVTKSTGIITTVAGTLGSQGSTGDNGSATSAKLSGPEGVAVDSAGNIYIADGGNHVVRKVTASTGKISTVAGTITVSGSTGDGGLATSAKLNQVYGVALDASDNLYIVDANNAAIRKVTVSTGIITTVAGVLTAVGSTGDNGIATNAKLSNPGAIAFDSAGNLYIGDTGNDVIRKVDVITGIITTVAGTIGVSGSTGDNGLATSAKMLLPFDTYD